MSEALNLHRETVAAQSAVSNHEAGLIQDAFSKYESYVINRYERNHSDLVADKLASDQVNVANQRFIAAAVGLLPPVTIETQPAYDEYYEYDHNKGRRDITSKRFFTKNEYILNSLLATTCWTETNGYSSLTFPRYIIGKTESELLLAEPWYEGASEADREWIGEGNPSAVFMSTLRLKNIEGRAARKRLDRTFMSFDTEDLLSEDAKNACFDKYSLQYKIDRSNLAIKGVRAHTFMGKNPDRFEGPMSDMEMVKYDVAQRLAFLSARFGKIVEFNDTLSQLHGKLGEIYGHDEAVEEQATAVVRLQKEAQADSTAIQSCL